MPGPKPQPTAVKRAKGNPGKRALNKREPQPAVGLPSCPAEFTDEQRAVWDEVGMLLLRSGIMTELDGKALADLAEIEVLNRHLTLAMRDVAPIDINARGESKKNPLWALKLEYFRERRAQHEKFGMTPASRSRITATESKPTDPLEAAMFQPPPPSTDDAEDEWSAQH